MLSLLYQKYQLHNSASFDSYPCKHRTNFHKLSCIGKPKQELSTCVEHLKDYKSNYWQQADKFIYSNLCWKVFIKLLLVACGIISPCKDKYLQRYKHIKYSSMN